MATREQLYTQQLKDLGIYDKAFDPEIHTLAIMERDLQRLQKRHKQAVKDGESGDDVFALIASIRRDILAHRDALGLTPKALQRLRGKGAGPADGMQTVNALLDEMLKEAEAYG